MYKRLLWHSNVVDRVRGLLRAGDKQHRKRQSDNNHKPKKEMIEGFVKHT